jgi:pimeloyl-ACP methyl ester carboxylesterase
LLLMLHGWADTGSCFQFLVDEMQTERFIVAPDWRGFGESRQRCEAYWFPDYLADLHDLLEIYSPRGPAAILGHSMGGNVAGLYAGVMPDRVAAFINVEGFGLPDGDPQHAPAHFRRWILQSAETTEFSTFGSYAELTLRIRKRSPALSEQRALYVAREWAQQGDDGLVRIKADPAHKLPNAMQYRRAESQACWAGITAPVMLIYGEDSDFRDMPWDNADGNDDNADKSGNSSPLHGARRLGIAGSGHMVHFEQPAALAVAVEDFLQSL